MSKRMIAKAQVYGVGYLRYSSDLQESFEDQKTAIQACSIAMGVNLPDNMIFSDEAKSRDMFLKRDGLQRMLKQLEDPNCKFLFVMWFNRLYGNDETQQLIFKALRRNGVRLFDHKGQERNKPNRTHDEKLLDTLDAWQIEGQVIQIRQGVRDTHFAKARTGRFVGKPPYGIDVVPLLTLPCTGRCVDKGAGCPVVHGEVSKKNGTVWVINDSKMDTVRMIFRWVADEGLSVSGVQNRLKALGITSDVRVVKRGENEGRVYGGKTWAKSNLWKMLTEIELYKGVLVYGKRKTVHDGDDVFVELRPEEEWIVRDHVFTGMLVDPDMWDRAQVMLESRRNIKSGEERVYPPLLFDGLVRCARCNWRMSPSARHRTKTKDTKYYLYCTGLTNEYSPCNGSSHSIPEHWLLPTLAALLLGEKLPHIEAVLEAGKVVDNSAEIRVLEEELAGLPGQRENIETMAIKGFWKTPSGEIDMDKVMFLTAAIDEREAELRARIETLREVPKNRARLERDLVPNAVRESLELLKDSRIPMEERQAELRRWLRRVEVDRDSAQPVRFLFSEDLLEPAA